MSFEVYKADLSNRYEITHAVGIKLTRYYNGIGKMTLIVPIDDYNINALENNGIVYDTSTGETYIIEQIKYDVSLNQITANGYTCNWILNKRAVTSAETITNVESGIYATVSHNLRGLPNINVHSSIGMTAETEDTLYGGQLLDTIIPILDGAEYGHRMIWNPDTNSHTFEIFQGNDLTSGIHAVVFSEERGTATRLTITDDNSTFKNYFYLPCKLADDTEILVEYGSATAENRYEWWISSFQQQSSDETEDEFRQRMKTECAAEAAQRLRRQNFTVDIEAVELGSAYNLGDKVLCTSSRFGIEFSARIKGVKYDLDARGNRTSLILGEPQLTALEEVKLG